MTAGALTLCSASITAFKASAAGINAVATPTAAAFTRMGSGSGTVHCSDHSAGPEPDDGNISIHGRIWQEASQ